MKTYLFEARHGPSGPGNWGKFAVGVPDEAEWGHFSRVDPFGRRLLTACGWQDGHIWVFDLQTGEACCVRPGGSAHADLQKRRVAVCPLFEPWLEWLYEQIGKVGIDGIGDLERVVDLPDAEFALYGYRRPGRAGR